LAQALRVAGDPDGSKVVESRRQFLFVAQGEHDGFTASLD
jgi:hypothetical protein